MCQVTFLRETRQDPGGRNWHRSHGGLLLSSLLPLACWVDFFIHPRITCSGMALPTVNQVFSYQPLIRKITHRPVWQKTFFPLPRRPYLCALDKILESTARTSCSPSLPSNSHANNSPNPSLYTLALFLNLSNYLAILDIPIKKITHDLAFCGWLLWLCMVPRFIFM